MLRIVESVVSRVALALIRSYQIALSPLLGANCRFQPTCSSYAAEAIRAHGLLRGVSLAMRRISRCHPWNPGGYDPVPSKRTTPSATGVPTNHP